MTQPPSSTPAPAPGAGDETWTVLRLLQWTAGYFRERGLPTARLDAECLLAHALGSERVRLYIDYDKPVTEAERARFRELVRRRVGERIPVALLLGVREFWSLPIRVRSGVLVPRPETETLVSVALDLLGARKDRDAAARILELGTGSGAVSLALAQECPKAEIVATDVSQTALEVARENVAALAPGRVELRHGDLYAPVAGERFDLVVANLPYVPEPRRAELPPELRHEPEQALFGGPEGTDLLARLIAGAPEHLSPGGGLALECDPGQIRNVTGWCRKAGLLSVRTHRDLSGLDRVVAAKGGG